MTNLRQEESDWDCHDKSIKNSSLYSHELLIVKLIAYGFYELLSTFVLSYLKRKLKRRIQGAKVGSAFNYP